MISRELALYFVIEIPGIIKIKGLLAASILLRVVPHLLIKWHKTWQTDGKVEIAANRGWEKGGQMICARQPPIRVGEVAADEKPAVNYSEDNFTQELVSTSGPIRCPSIPLTNAAATWGTRLYQ